MAPQLPPSQGQGRRLVVKKAAPFCNYHKYVAHHAALAGASPFVTTVRQGRVRWLGLGAGVRG